MNKDVEKDYLLQYLPEHNISLTLYLNQFRWNFKTAAEWIGDMDAREHRRQGWISEEEVTLSKQRNVAWEVLWYPSTRGGFNSSTASSIDALLTWGKDDPQFGDRLRRYLRVFESIEGYATLDHNEHNSDYQTAKQWIHDRENGNHRHGPIPIDWIAPEHREIAIATDSIWTLGISFVDDNNDCIDSWDFAAADLESLLEAAVAKLRERP